MSAMGWTKASRLRRGPFRLGLALLWHRRRLRVALPSAAIHGGQKGRREGTLTHNRGCSTRLLSAAAPLCSTLSAAAGARADLWGRWLSAPPVLEDERERPLFHCEQHKHTLKQQCKTQMKHDT